MKGKSEECQDSDDYFGTSNCAHGGPLKWVLDRNEPLESVGDREPNTEAGKDGTSIDRGLTKSLPIEEIDPDVIQPNDQQSQKESNIS